MLTPYQAKRTFEIAEAYFGTSSHPDQIPITEESFNRLMSIHKETIKMKADEAGEPISWVVVVPTSKETMNLFLNNTISEKELFDRAVEEKKFEALYLCSAFTVPEHKRKGYARELILEAINEFATDESVDLYAWIYTPEGQALADSFKGLQREIRFKNNT